MSWLGLLLVGVGLADLVRSAAARLTAGCVGAVVAVLLGLLAGLTGWHDAVAYVVVAGAVLVWSATSGAGRRTAWVPLTVLGGAVLLGVLTAAWAGSVDGPLADWLDASPWGWLAGADPDTALLALGGVLVQLATGNAVVRLVLVVTGTEQPTQPTQPARRAQPGRPGPGARRTLQGGRLLGPMERLVILGLGLAGHVTAASLVIAAKGLIRWPELQSFRDGDGAPGGARIDEVTEYFLVGSFVSWLLSLGTLAILAT